MEATLSNIIVKYRLTIKSKTDINAMNFTITMFALQRVTTYFKCIFNKVSVLCVYIFLFTHCTGHVPLIDNNNL